MRIRNQIRVLSTIAFNEIFLFAYIFQFYENKQVSIFQADLNPLFNWNVKQLFLYLTAEYQTPSNELNQVVLNML